MRAEAMSVKSLITFTLAAILLAGCSQGPEVVDGASVQLAPDVQAEWDQFHGQFPEIKQPVVPLVRSVDREDWALVIAECLSEAGFPDVSADVDGGLSFSLATGQAEAFGLAKFICVAQFPLESKYTEPLSDEKLAKLYDYLTQVQAPCLEGLGYPISTPPSKQRFIETYLVAPEWLPYGELPANVYEGEEIDIALESCPDQPPKGSDYYLY